MTFLKNNTVTPMKRSFYLLLIMVVAAIAACTKPTNDFEDERLNPASTTYTYTITASNVDLATKSDYDAEGHFKWSAGDAISVLFHNNDAEVKNKFFTLTLVSGANNNTATFSGEIDNGYTIGASDGTESDKKIWAFFPASTEHSYVAEETPKFYIPSETDFTSTHFSANMPMYDLLTKEGALTFKNLAAGFKFKFTNIATAVNKVLVKVDNNAKTYKLSGSIPISLTDEEYKLDPAWGDSGVARTISFIADVDKLNNEVVVYVPVRRNTAYFQPTIDLYDYNTGNRIVHKTASSAITTPVKGVVKPISINTGNTAGTAPTFTSSFGITWANVTSSIYGNSSAPSGHNDSAIRVFKATADASYIYLYLEVDKSSLLLDGSHDYANPLEVYVGNSESTESSWMWDSNTKYSKSARAAWLTNYGGAAVNSWEGIYAGSGSTGGHAETWGKYFYYEIRLKRSYHACMQITGTENIGITVYYEKYNGGPSTDAYMYCPSSGDQMLQITLPAYEAPTE